MSGTVDERTPLLTADVQETQITVERESLDDRESQDALRSAPRSRESASSTAPSRLITPDLLRGLLMVLMAVDHVNQGIHGFPHGTGSAAEAADFPVVRWTNDLGYALRTLSHLCAPGFTMLLGMGLAFFFASRSKSTAVRSKPWNAKQYVKHIVLRFVALVFANSLLTLVLIGRGYWFFNIVLLALAFDYLVVGLLAVVLLSFEPMIEKLAVKALSESRSTNATQRARAIAFHAVNAVLLISSAVTIWMNIWLDPQQGDCRRAAHTTLYSLPPETTSGAFGIMDVQHAEMNCTNDRWKLFYNVLFHPTVCRGILSIFPPMAWLPFAIFGLLYGRLLLSRLQSTKKTGRSAGSPDVTLEASLTVILSLLFVSTRIWSFGDLSTNCLRTPEEYSDSDISRPYLASLKAFFYVVKYPPSPAFAFFSLAGNFALFVLFSLSAAPSISPLAAIVRSDMNPLLVYGRQSLFFYVIHLTVNSLFGPLLLKTRIAHLIPADRWDGKEDMFGIGLNVYFFAYYAALLAVMYGLCSAYGRFKARQSPESIWRFF